MNTGTWFNKYSFTGDDKFWKCLSKDSKKQMLGTYEEYIRNQKKSSRKVSEEDEEGGEYND
jgi:hypothetical protein